MKRLAILFFFLSALAFGSAAGGMGDACARSRIEVYQGDNLPLMKKMPSESVDLIYIDPPFNTGRRQERKRKDGESFGYDDSPSGKEKTGYATQKPRGIIDRIVKVHSREGDVCFDFFAGSGTLGESAYVNGRSAILIDCNPDAIAVMRKRFVNFDTRWHVPEGDGL